MENMMMIFVVLFAMVESSLGINCQSFNAIPMRVCYHEQTQNVVPEWKEMYWVKFKN